MTLRANNKAQLSAFMIVGVLMIALFGLWLFISSPKADNSGKESTTSVDNYIKQCIESTAGYGLYLVGIHGGAINSQPEVFSDGTFSVAYAYKNQKTLPSLDTARADLERYINENLNAGDYSCLKNLAQFQKIYANITIGPVATEVIFAEEDTIIRVNMSVRLQKAGETKEYDEFERSLPIRFKKIHAFIDSLADKSSSGRIPMSIFNNGIKGYVVQDIAPEAALFAFTDPKSKFEGGDFIFLSVMAPEAKKAVCEG